jgi:hypothetical protein
MYSQAKYMTDLKWTWITEFETNDGGVFRRTCDKLYAYESQCNPLCIQATQLLYTLYILGTITVCIAMTVLY